RIFKASESGGSFSKVGSTTSTSFSANGSGIYHVKAVDYFGRESSASNEITIGNVSDSDEEEDKEEDKKENDQEKDNKDDNDKNGNNNSDENGNNENAENEDEDDD